MTVGIKCNGEYRFWSAGDSSHLLNRVLGQVQLIGLRGAVLCCSDLLDNEDPSLFGYDYFLLLGGHQL